MRALKDLLCRPFVFCPLLALGYASIGQSAPPYHTLTHEYTMGLTAGSFILVFFLAAAIARRQREYIPAPMAAAAALPHVLVFAGLLGVAALGVTAAANAFGAECRTSAGLPFFAVTWPPAVLFAAICGSLLGAAGFGNAAAALILTALAALTLTHDAFQLYFGPRVFPIDFILGNVASASQRETMTPALIHVTQRLYLLGWTWAVWSLGRWALHRRAPGAAHPLAVRMLGARGAVVGAALLGVGVFAGDYVGVGIGRNWLHRQYNQAELTEHFEVRFRDDPKLLAQLDAIKREAEWNWRVITQLWGIAPTERVRLYVFANRDELYRFTGLADAHSGIGEVFVDYESARSEVMRHELVHALHHILNPTPRVLLYRGMLEGTATAFESPMTQLPEAHELQAAAFRAGKLPSAASVMSVFGFVQNMEWAAYRAAGSFLGYLVYAYGMDDFLALQRTLNFRRVYGKSIEALDQEWRSFLAAVPVRSDTRLAASQYFDPAAFPPYRAAECPKVGKSAPTLESEAERAYLRGAHARAAELYEELYRARGEARFVRRAASSLARLGALDRSLEILDNALHNEGLKDFEYAELVEQRIRLLVRRRDWPGVYRAFDDRAASGVEVPLPARMAEVCLRDPDLRETYARILEREDPADQVRLWEALVALRPDSEAVLYLFATRRAPDGTPLSVRAQAVLHAARTTPRLADWVAPTLFSLYREALSVPDYALATALCKAAVQFCSNPLYQYEGREGLQRIEFEQGTVLPTLHDLDRTKEYGRML